MNENENENERIEPDENGGNVEESAPEDGSGVNETQAESGVYDAVMSLLQEVKANQAQMQAQIKSLSDFRSVIIDSGATVRESNADDYEQTSGNDGFVPIDELDLNL